MNKRFIIPALLFAALFVVGGVPRWMAHQKLMAGEARSVLEVQVAMGRQVGSGNLTLPGNLEAYEETSVSARTTGVVAKRYVDIGSKVRKGQVLAEIDAPDLDSQTDQAVADVAKAAATSEQSQANIADAQAQVARSAAKVKQSQAALAASLAQVSKAERAVETQRAQLRTAKSRLELSDKTNRRWQTLLKDGAVPPQDADDKRSQYEQALAQVQASQSSLRESQAQLEAAQAQVAASRADVNASLADENSASQHVQAAIAGHSANLAGYRSSQANAARYNALRNFEKVTAPFNGVITARNVDVGSLVGGGAPAAGMFHLARADQLRIKVHIPEIYVSSVKNDESAIVRVTQFGPRQFEGKVFRLSGALDENTRTLLVEVRVDNPTGILLPGMYGQVQFQLNRKAPIRVPASCVMLTSKGNQVGVVDDQQQVHYRVVELGEDFGTEIEIVKGVEPSDRVLTSPSYSIPEGSAVKATLTVEATPTTGSGSPTPSKAKP